MAQIYASKTNEIQKYETEHENEVRHLAGECMVLWRMTVYYHFQIR